MANKKSSPPNTDEQAREIREAWQNIDPTITLGGFSLTDLTGAMGHLAGAKQEITNLESQLTQARNNKTDKQFTLWEIVKRARTAVKAQFGDDSTEYEMFGGTRISERKLGRSTPKPETGVES